MEELLNFIKDFNIQTLISIIIVIWYFTRDIKASIDNVDRDLKAMNTRISRLEGTAYGKDIYNKLGD